jgi:hypothetical protein
VQLAELKPADVLDDREFELRSSARHAVGQQLRLEAVDEASSPALANCA